tara:strand:- start:678 stop:902 length:225 start_codon:yes stop_codon:yes gene_type:complete
MGAYNPTERDLDIRMWCHRNHIFITPVETGYRERKWYIEIDIRGKIYKSPEHYTPTTIWDKILEYRKYYYEKYR